MIKKVLKSFTPLRPLEASSTSGMKAAHNGVPSLSILDGWWIEGHIEGVTGWSIGPRPSESSQEGDVNARDAAELYQKLRRSAAMADVHYVSLARLEAGLLDPRLSTLQKLCKVLGVSLTELVSKQPSKKGGR